MKTKFLKSFLSLDWLFGELDGGARFVIIVLLIIFAVLIAIGFSDSNIGRCSDEGLKLLN